MDERATIADLKRRLAESEARHRLLIGTWAQAVWETDATGVVTADSPSWRAYTGQSLEEWLGSGWIDAIHPDDRAYAERQWREATAVRGLVDAEFRLRAPDGGWRWTNVRAAPVLDDTGRLNKWVGINIDIDVRKRAEMALRESEERQAFLLKLSDALRPLRDTGQIQRVAMALLGEQLTVNRAAYYQVAADEITFFVTASWERGAPPPLPERMLITDFGGDMLEAYRAGRTIVARDTEQDIASDDIQMAVRPLQVRGWIGVPLVKEGRWFASIGVHSLAPRDWALAEIRLVEDVAERTWDAIERARAEAALRENEEWQAALLKLSDALRPLANPTDIQGETTRLLREQLSASWCYYVDWDLDRQTGLVLRDSVREGLPSLAGAHDVSDALEFLQLLAGGATLTVRDYANYEQLPTRIRQKFTALGFRSMMAAPLVKEGRLIATLLVGDTEIRDWSASEASLLVEVAEHTWAAIERGRAEAELRANEERQAFLLKLSDALRAEPDADAVANRALGMLLDQLRLDRCYITYYRPAEDEAVFPYQLGNNTVPPLPAKVRLSDFPEAYQQVLDRTFVIDDDFERRGLSEAERANSKALGMRAMVASTVRRGERRPLCSMAAVSSSPRRWTQAEIALVEEAAERTWAAIERTRAEVALRASEERFRQFADASASGLWIRAADTLAMEFVSPATATIYGVGQDSLLGEVTLWASLIVPEDRDAALAHLEKARSGEVAVREFRIQRNSDGAFRWIRNTNFPLHDNGNIPRIGGIAEDVTEAKLATEHSAVLLAELQHRVRNIMALLRSITNRTAERAESVPEYRDLMMGRLLAFARVQALLTRTANVSVGITSIVHDEVSVQAQHKSQYVLDGPDVTLSPKAAEVLTLAIHELATNAVKYGALSVPTGRITVRWSTFEKRGGLWLGFDWTEEGAPPRPPPAPDAPRRRGFGSELIEARIPYELRGRGQVTIEPGGARCHLEFPLQHGASILETGAPLRATVFGGAIDMTGESDLTGRRVLVVEDDFYLATDTARALRGAGAEVMGPCATEEDARAELEEQRPDAVVVDINLGPGPSFKLAETLKDRRIPFVFTTGYDAEVIPAEFEAVERLQKPLQLRQIVDAVTKLTTAA